MPSPDLLHKTKESVVVHDRVYLRKILDDEVPANGTDADSLFSDVEVDDLLDRFSTINMAAAVGWAVKAGRLSRLIDIEESGSRRRLQQKHTNALRMAEFYQKLSGSDQAAIAAAVRVVGIAASPYKPSRSSPVPVQTMVAIRAGGMWISYVPLGVGDIPIGYNPVKEPEGELVSEFPLELTKGRTYRLSVDYVPENGGTLDGWTLFLGIKESKQSNDYIWSGSTTTGSLTLDPATRAINLIITDEETAAMEFEEGLYELVGTSPSGEVVTILFGPAYLSVGVVL